MVCTIVLSRKSQWKKYSEFHWGLQTPAYNSGSVGQIGNMASSMPIAVEQLLESRVQEISRDGQETYVP
jgi:hypothetical protein